MLPMAALALHSGLILSAWIAMLAAYLTAVLAASVHAARRYGWTLLAALPLVFVAYHFSVRLRLHRGLAPARSQSRLHSRQPLTPGAIKKGGPPK